jgi:microcystin-dependent protein
MSVNVTFSVGSLPVGYCWVSPQQYAQDLFGASGGIITATVPGAGNPVIISGSDPGASYHDGQTIWARTVGGYIEGFYIWLGGWYRPHPIAPSAQSRIIWMGSEANLWAYDGGDGNDPGSIAPTATTGAMWQRDTTFGDETGSNIFRIPIGAGKNPTAYDGGTALTIAIGGTGGVERLALASTEMPPHSHGVTKPDHTTQIFEMDNLVAGTSQVSYPGASNPPATPLSTTIEGGNGASPSVVVSHNNLPPYIGVIFAKRTIRQMILAT